MDGIYKARVIPNDVENAAIVAIKKMMDDFLYEFPIFLNKPSTAIGSFVESDETFSKEGAINMAKRLEVFCETLNQVKKSFYVKMKRQGYLD